MIERVLIDIDGTVGNMMELIREAVKNRNPSFSYPKEVYSHDRLNLSPAEWNEGQVAAAIRDAQHELCFRLKPYEDAGFVLRTLSLGGELHFATHRPPTSPIESWLKLILGLHAPFQVHFFSPEVRIDYMRSSGKDILIDDRLETHYSLLPGMYGLVPLRSWNMRMPLPPRTQRFQHWRQVPTFLLAIKNGITA